MANDFTIAEFLDWARTKPADGFYHYWDVNACAVAQFVTSVGLPLHGDQRQRLERELGPFILDTPFHDGRRKFGDLVKRLEQEVQEQPVVRSPWLRPQTYLDADCGKLPA